MALFQLRIARDVPVMVSTAMNGSGAGAQVTQKGEMSSAKWSEPCFFANPIREIVSIVGGVAKTDVKYVEMMHGSSQQLEQCICLECHDISEDAINPVYGSVAAFVGGVQGIASGYLSWGSLPSDPYQVNEIRSRIHGVLDCLGGKVLSAPLRVHAQGLDALTIAGRLAPRPAPEPIAPKLEVIEGYYDGYCMGKRALYVAAPGNVAHCTIHFEAARSLERILEVGSKVTIHVMARIACHVRTESKGSNTSHSLQSIEFLGTEDRFCAEDGLPF